MKYREEDYLMLSGIQHFYYCKRQWCLIHVEQQWADNQWTAEGHLVHKKVDNPYIKEKRKNRFISRAVPVASSTLGFSGTLDVVEFTKDEKGIEIPRKRGKWLPTVVEFKRGKKKKDLRDIVQLVAQVICLEEKFNIEIPTSYLYYDQTNDKVKVEITKPLRKEVQETADEMHYLFKHGITLGPEYCKCDKGCSLYEISMPSLAKKSEKIKDYLEKNMDVDLL
jgi:CRISPR-associated exonuclease Cas4